MTKKGIQGVLDKLKIEPTGVYEDQLYIIKLHDSNEYAKMYTILDDTTTNMEYPEFDQNSSKSVTDATSYFETTLDDITYKIFLVANFTEDSYMIKIGEKEAD